MIDKKTFNEKLASFINDSPSAFHAVKNIAETLGSAGFARLNECDVWNIQRGKKYFLTRNDSSIIAFSTGLKDASETGLRMLGTHTDSPCLKIKPNPLYVEASCLMLGVEVYGGALLRTWFDRELSIAGRVTFLRLSGKTDSVLVDFKRPVAIIPSLAIHLNKEANASVSINAQKELPALIGLSSADSETDFNAMLLAQIRAEHGFDDIKAVLAHDLFLYDCRPVSFFGINNEFIAGARLDNLVSCFTGLEAALDAAESNLPFCLVFYDHEETGSLSFHGAAGSFLRDVLVRLYPTPEEHNRVISRSLFVSMDNAHAAHPNYLDSYDPNHRPKPNGGPVIKMNAAQRYSTNSETAAVIRAIAMRLELPVQTFTGRSDMSSGTTIGPIASAETGIRAVDVGVPTFAMHSSRETGGINDAYFLFKIVSDLLNNGS